MLIALVSFINHKSIKLSQNRMLHWLRNGIVLAYEACG